MAVIFSSTAGAYQLLGYKWPQPSTTFYVDIPSEDGLWNDSFETAMYSWGVDTKFKFMIVHGVYEDTCDPTDGRNGVGFESTDCGDAWGSTTLAVTHMWYIGTSFIQTDITFNSNESWNVYSTSWSSWPWSGVSDFQRVAIHELGHALGLDHEDSGIATIMGTYAGDIIIPQQDDINGVGALYGFPIIDTDGDGVSDSIDNCPMTTNENQNDSDSDSIGNVCDACPNDQDNDLDSDGVCGDIDVCPIDPLKSSNAGQCGCNIAETDSDNDGTADCLDQCPNDPNKSNDSGTCGCGVADTDSDGDTALDCIESCDTDPDKTEPGVCGCGIPDTDSDSDSTADCIDTDDDGDGLLDGAEDLNHDGTVDTGETDPLDPNDPCAYRDYFVVNPMYFAFTSSDTDKVVFFDSSQSLCFEMLAGSCEKESRVCTGEWDFGGEGDIVGGNGYDIFVFRYDQAGDYPTSLTMTEQDSGTTATDNLTVTAEIVQTPLPVIDFETSIDADTATVSVTITDTDPSDAEIASVIVFWGDRYRVGYNYPLQAPIEHTYTRTSTDYHIRVKMLNLDDEEFNYTFTYDEDLTVNIP